MYICIYIILNAVGVGTVWDLYRCVHTCILYKFVQNSKFEALSLNLLLICEIFTGNIKYCQLAFVALYLSLLT